MSFPYFYGKVLHGFSYLKKIMEHIQFYKNAISAGDCVSNGWNLVTKNFGMYLGIAIVAMILAGCIPCVSLFLVGPILTGIYYVCLRDISGEPVEFGMMFRGFDVFVPAMIVGIIQSIPEMFGQGLRFSVNIADIFSRGGNSDHFQSDGAGIALLGGLTAIIIVVGLAIFLMAIVLRISLFFAFPLIIEHKLGAVDAMKLSARAAWSNIGGLILLFILEFFVALIGILACIMGIFVAIPVIYAANAFAYRQVFPRIENNFQNVPPPPNAYGGTYGVAQHP